MEYQADILCFVLQALQLWAQLVHQLHNDQQAPETCLRYFYSVDNTIQALSILCVIHGVTVVEALKDILALLHETALEIAASYLILSIVDHTRSRDDPQRMTGTHSHYCSNVLPRYCRILPFTC